MIPAIDLKDGKCVRLFQGEFDRQTVYSDDPLAVAQRFADGGAHVVNVIDLDGASTASDVNVSLIRKLIGFIGLKVQVGGGIRTFGKAAHYLEQGAAAVILGTASVENPELVRQLIESFGADRVIIAADIKDGYLAIQGWTRQSPYSVDDTVKLLSELGAKRLLVTDISKDGTLEGPGLEICKVFIDAGFEVIAAGGVRSADDLKTLEEAGAWGAVLGTALYENKISLDDALKVTSTNGLTKRIIPCLDVKDGRVVKGTNFKDLRDIGDPVEISRKYADEGADEIVILNVAASAENWSLFIGLVEEVAKAITVPLTVGGGVASVDDVRALLATGADKVSIASAAVTKPGLVREVAEYFGAQCIVISVDAKRRGESWVIHINGGTTATDLDAIEFAKAMQQEGAGELLVNSLDRDGMNAGFDLDLLQAITSAVSLPVIASSGGGSVQDFIDVFKSTDVDAALGASIFHFEQQTPNSLKTELSASDIKVRISK